MSHTVTIKVEMNDQVSLLQAVERLEGFELVRPAGRVDARQRTRANSIEDAIGEHAIYSGTFKGIGVQLPGWNWPAIIDTESGEVRYDNYNGSWGAQAHMDELVQAYSVSKAYNTALMHGMTVHEELQENGDIKLTIADYRE
jgi:hypothetical protein